jgi:hypothetical protein
MTGQFGGTCTLESCFCVGNIGQLAAGLRSIVFAMAEKIRLLSVEIDGDDGLIAMFSDGTTSGYVVEELLELRPCRERIREAKDQNLPQIPPAVN